MATRSTTATVLSIAGATALLSTVAYVAYFDYQRRNNAEFRKKLKKQKKQVSKSRAMEASVSAASSSQNDADSTIDLEAAIRDILKEPMPATPIEVESYFLEQAGLGDQMLNRGPLFVIPAALQYFKALRAHPAPAELLQAIQTGLPPTVYQKIIEIINLSIVIQSTPASNPAAASQSSSVDTGIDDDNGASTTSTHSQSQSESQSPKTASRGPPSETSSQEWDRLTDPGTQSGTLS